MARPQPLKIAHGVLRVGREYDESVCRCSYLIQCCVPRFERKAPHPPQSGALVVPGIADPRRNLHRTGRSCDARAAQTRGGNLRSTVVVLAALVVCAAVPSSAEAKTCSGAYVHAVIGGEQKCLGRGEYCAVGDRRQSPKYGFACQDVDGNYRLEPRT